MNMKNLLNAAGRILLLIVIVVGTTLITENFSYHSNSAVYAGFKVDNPKAYQDTTYLTKGRALLEEFSDAFEAAASKISPSVVPIFAEEVKTVQNPFYSPENPFKQFFGQGFFKGLFGSPNEKETIHSLGSGVIVSSDGYILTNNHVVHGASKLTVVLTDKHKYPAKIIGTDPQTDIAVIKIDVHDLPAATLGNSDNLKIGQWVIADGNPFQLMHTVTAGIISATGRNAIGLTPYEDFIQTDASINPGNSGGALADLDGNVIGINTAISSPSGGNVGIGFAIPINMAKKVMDQLIKHGSISRGYLAIIPQDITHDLSKALNIKSTKGVLVGDVVKGGPADKAGIKTGDIILKFGSTEIKSSVQLRNLVAETEPNTVVPITILRNNVQKEIKVKLGKRPNKIALNQNTNKGSGSNYSNSKLGLSVQNLAPAIAKKLGYSNEQGVVVSNVVPGSPAEEAGIRANDLIKEVNKNKVTSVSEFEKIISKTNLGNAIAFLIQRGGATFYLTINVSS
jgi:serine protease Do